MQILDLKMDSRGLPTLAVEKECLNDMPCMEPIDVMHILQKLFDIDHLMEENVWVLCLRGAGGPFAVFHAAKGALNYAPVDPKGIFTRALLCGATDIIVIHNHTSGTCRPSKEDVHTTKKLIQAGELLQLPCRDHIIIGKNELYSFRENRDAHCLQFE